MTHTLMKLPFDEGALEPHISKKTLQYHFGKHHAGYVNKLNALIKDTMYEEMTLEEVIKVAVGSVFNNASQIYNHDFYFNGLSGTQTKPSKLLQEWINRDFGSVETFKNEFLQTAANLFGSGWVWLSVDQEGTLVIESRSNADSPLLYNHTPLMTCDVWEHAYYIDYQNARADYLEKWWELVNWDFVSQNLSNYVNPSLVAFQCDEKSSACAYTEA